MSYSCAVLNNQYISELYGVAQADELDGFNYLIGVSIFATFLGILFVMVVLCDQIVIILNRLSIIDRIRLDQKRLIKN